MAKHLLIIMLILVIQLHGYNGLLEKERQGLLHLKAYFTTHNQSMDPLTSWNGANCCDWIGVRCNSMSSHIVELSLVSLLDNDDSINTIYFFDASLFKHFKKLKSVDLSYNGFSGFTNHSYLENLREFTASNNQMNDLDLLQGLCNTKNLVKLDINSNDFSGPFPQCIVNLTNLEFLDISSNQFTGTIPSTISSLTSIKILQLDDNNFQGKFSFSSLANSSKLKVFQLSTTDTTNLQVETQNPPFTPTFQLNVLKLSSCNLNKNSASNIPMFLLTQHDLRFLDLSHNKLVGMFPVWLLQNNTKLNFLILTNNSLTGSFQLPSFKHHLHYLRLSSNCFNGQLPDDIGFLLPKLSHFNISWNNFEGNLSLSIGSMRRLNVFDLSNNKFSGKLKVSIFSNMFQLSRLQLGNNNFSGSIHDGIRDSPDLIVFDISNNAISGKIYGWIGQLTNLLYLGMSRNLLKGKLPVALCSLQYLKFFDISQNQLSGRVPSCFNLQNQLKYLYFQDNNFSGSIPKAFSKSPELTLFDLSRNGFSGHIPKWVKRYSSLQFLLLKGNRFRGSIPREVCELREMSIMDFSSNKLNGAIPSCLGNMSFGISKGSKISSYETMGVSFDTKFSVEIDVISNKEPLWWTISHQDKYSEGQIEVYFITKNREEQYKGNILKYMSGLDLSDNQLTGLIPQQIGELQKIHALNFSHNKLKGQIPNTLCNLKQLESLDLSCNMLIGDIPFKLSDLDFLSFLNVSFNNLSGIVPMSPHFRTFLESSYLGNPHLCGPLAGKNCSALEPTPKRRSDEVMEDEDHEIGYVEAFYWSFVASYFMVLLGLVTVLSINPQWRGKWFYYVDVCFFYLFKYIY